MIVEVVGGADQRPEVRVVDAEDLSRVVLALGEVTDEEADQVLRSAGLGRMADADTALLDPAALRTAAGSSAAGEDWARGWAERTAPDREDVADGMLRVPVQSAAGA